MKDGHPKYYPNAKVTCACGNAFTTGSTSPEIKVELCSNCHPFFTGKSNLVDTAGRIDRFRARTARSSKLAEARKKRVSDKQAKAAATARLAKGTAGTAGSPSAAPTATPSAK